MFLVSLELHYGFYEAFLVEQGSRSVVAPLGYFFFKLGFDSFR